MTEKVKAVIDEFKSACKKNPVDPDLANFQKLLSAEFTKDEYDELLVELRKLASALALEAGIIEALFGKKPPDDDPQGGVGRGKSSRRASSPIRIGRRQRRA